MLKVSECVPSVLHRDEATTRKLCLVKIRWDILTFSPPRCETLQWPVVKRREVCARMDKNNNGKESSTDLDLILVKGCKGVEFRDKLSSFILVKDYRSC